MIMVSIWLKLRAAVIVVGFLVSLIQPALTGHGASQAAEPQGVDGNLDPSFGNGGKVVTDFFGNDDEVLSVAVQADGKIIAGGFCLSSAGLGAYPEFALARYMASSA